MFAHKDFRFGNLLVTDSDGIVVTDFDFASYDDRGFDFATLFYDYITSSGAIDFSNEKYMKTFISDYINESNHWMENNILIIRWILWKIFWMKQKFIYCIFLYV